MENQYTQPQFSNTPPRSLPNATATLVLGIISIVLCWCIGIVGLTCGIIAIYLAGKDKKLYLASPASYTDSSYNNIKAGKICAIIGIVLSGLYLAYIIFWWVVFGTFFMSNYHDLFRGMQS